MMAEVDFTKLTADQILKLRVTLIKDVKEICQEAAEVLDLTFKDDAIQLVAELAWKKLQFYGTDLEQFAKHARRTTVNMDDVKLLVRRNTSLKDYLITYGEKLSQACAMRENSKKRKAIASSSKAKEIDDYEPSISKYLKSDVAAEDYNDNDDNEPIDLT